ncbi:copper chaperone PCu(A)C [Porticoccaceae bacterium]|nr:copper chaperone PCu(A)C [Porticoccaceae bacterium]
MKTRLIYAVIFCLAMPFAWATSAADFSVEDAYIRTMPPGRTATAGYLYLTNNGDRDCSIIGGSAAIAGTLEIHQQLNSDGMMKMRPVAAVTVTAGETLLFRPGGYHLMLIDVQTELVAGETHPVSLTTEDCGSIEMDVKVRSLFQKSAPADKAHDHSKYNHSMPDHSMHDHSGHSMQKMKTHGMDK